MLRAPAALRESDLLAFELAMEHGRPGAVMCAYNLIGGTHACESLMTSAAAPKSSPVCIPSAAATKPVPASAAAFRLGEFGFARADTNQILPGSELRKISADKNQQPRCVPTGSSPFLSF